MGVAHVNYYFYSLLTSTRVESGRGWSGDLSSESIRLKSLQNKEERQPCYPVEVVHQRHQAVHDAHHSEPHSLELRKDRVMWLRVSD